MQTIRRPTGQFAHRLGRAAGRTARWLQRREHRAIGWLVAKGLPAPVAATLLWIVKLAVLAGLLYTAFWLALLLGFAIAAAWVAGKADWEDEPETEWRTGGSGFGLYRGDIRIDIGDPYESD